MKRVCFLLRKQTLFLQNNFKYFFKLQKAEEPMLVELRTQKPCIERKPINKFISYFLKAS